MGIFKYLFGNDEKSEEKVLEKAPEKRLVCTRELATVSEYSAKFLDAAINAEKQTGIPAIVMLAQVALETAWGRSILKVYPKGSSELMDSKNLFNIKATKSWEGMVGTRIVWEDHDKDGQRDDDEYQAEAFRMYDYYEDSFKDYANLILCTKRYKKAAQNRNNPDRFVEEMANAGYATDGEYAEKIKKIMHKNWDYA